MSIFNETAQRLAKEVNDYLMSVAREISRLQTENNTLRERIQQLEEERDQP